MRKIKQIWEEDKNEIILGTIIGGLAAATLLTSRYYKTNFHLIPKYRRAISWMPTGKFINLETAKAALDANCNNSSSFAIVKDGAEYVGIRLSGGVITP